MALSGDRECGGMENGSLGRRSGHSLSVNGRDAVAVMLSIGA